MRRRATARSPWLRSERAPIGGEERVGAGVSEVSVAEGAQRDVFGSRRAQGHCPRLLAVVDAEGVVLGFDPADACLRVVCGDLLAHGVAVDAPSHDGDAVVGACEFEGEGFRDGDGAEEVLDAEQGAFAGACGGDLQQRRGVLLWDVPCWGWMQSHKQVPFCAGVSYGGTEGVSSGPLFVLLVHV